MILAYTAVVDQDLQIRMGGGHSNPELRGGGGVRQNFFSVSSKNKGGGVAVWVPRPLPRICHCTVGCFGLVHDCFCLH